MPQGPLPRVWVLGAFAAGLGLQLVQAWGVGDRAWMAQHAVQFATGAAVWAFSTWPRARGFLRFVAVGVILALAAAYVANQFGALPGPRVPRGQRTGLWFGDPNPLGILIASVTAVAAMLITRARWLAVPLWALAAAVTTAMLTRGAVLAIVLGYVTWGLTRFRSIALRRWVLGSLLAVALVGASVVWGPASWSRLFGPAAVERFMGGGVVDPDGSGGVFARLRAHDAAWVIIRERWPWGAGHGGFADAYREYVAPGARYALGNAHHQLLDLLAVGGSLGLLAWLLPLAAAIWGLGSRGWWAMAPFVAVQAFFWGSEAPLVHASGFYATWTALGLARQAATGTWRVRWPCAGPVDAISASPGRPPR